ncbi:TetR/AcrR family transcriptional regulator [Hahella sp. CR1]|uniref:TetR/AcrR family transcriptional regulator n=1 Tax=Hahella sp. CR1 TaxID=2992807 RepID=UPI0024426E10|nr:TetR/AcrR family transcriptional regulator [Hahella sp. CR1]MDG9669504.1 TetR/AcrR family transcriptional regulator [Hahella sp. CR1]
MERNRLDENKNRRRLSGAAVKQEAVTQAIERALFQVWAKTGYAALTMEAVAKQAGVGKAAIYRRWPSKLAMVNDVLTRVGTSLAVAPDTGNLRGDILALLKSLRRLLRHPLVSRILPDLHAEMPRTPELAAAIRSELQVQRRARAKEILKRASARNELSADTDFDIAADMFGALIYWRMIITRQKADNAYLERLSDVMMKALGPS